MAKPDSEEIEVEREETPPEASSSHANPTIRAVADQDIGSAIAVAGHPIHAMLVHFPIALVICTLGVDGLYWITGDPFWVRVGLWSTGFAFAFGILASVAGTLELLAVPGIRVRVASWNHAIAAMTLVAVAGANFGLRLNVPEAVLPHGLMLSFLAAILTALAGWHGGKLVFDHGVGLIISTKQ
ncbi:Uncharacterized membrane protein [Devosia sp. YR412]|uniref:DUF2231 domain-containing protein n=1 Tax=Devosia sp. YR412 TaxID=1881030 RepID=UPI0008CE7098|nr:DUF2231 domain-containing protein [Devosia sp. YR412]SEP64287.1 Uncharacterized membrane protein [Devosia sp. YR412]